MAKQQLTAQDLGLYLGCRVEACGPEGVSFYGTLIGITLGDEHDEAIYRICPDNEDDPVVELEEEFFQPILRRLESMTEQEALLLAEMISEIYLNIQIKEVARYGIYFEHEYSSSTRRRVKSFKLTALNANQFRLLLSKGFDLFGYIDSGLALDADKLKK